MKSFQKFAVLVLEVVLGACCVLLCSLLCSGRLAQGEFRPGRCLVNICSELVVFVFVVRNFC
jgi:hypothetical protein